MRLDEQALCSWPKKALCIQICSRVTYRSTILCYCKDPITICMSESIQSRIQVLFNHYLNMQKIAEKTINLIRFIFIIQSLKCITKLSLVGMQLSEGPSFHPLLRRRAFARNVGVLLIFFMFCNCIPTNESFVIIGTTYTGTDSLLIHFFSMTVTAQQLAQ